MVVLHDHLDGGVRPATLLDLAVAAAVPVPADDVDGLARWLTITPAMEFAEAFSRFDLVVACLQTPEALRRVAREAVEDLSADGVIHAEIRFAPLLHTAGGLGPDAVLGAVAAGFGDAASADIDVRVIVCAIRERSSAESTAAAELAVRHRGLVVGFDLAGGEVGRPAADHAEAFAIAGTGGLGRTVHAGEMDGVHQVAGALETCTPDRLGHAWRLIDDCAVTDGRITALGPIATRVRDAAIPLEICLTSNACLGMPVADHPVRFLADAGFRVTFNPDDRSITTTTASREHGLAAAHHGFTAVELAAANERAALAAFVSADDRRRLAGRVREGWDVRHRRLVHLAERDRWEAALGAGVYLPAEFARDGFIHLSARHQLLTPANRFYRGRTDLVALELDVGLLGDAVVWEPGAGTAEFFPHLYSALSADAVVAERPLLPGADGSFLLPLGL